METILQKKPRRKFRYSSRESAEDAAIASGHRCDMLEAALNAVLRDEMSWLPKRYAGYRFGYVWHGGIVIFLATYHCAGQRTSTQCFGEESINREIENLCGHIPSDNEMYEYRNGMIELRKEAVKNVR